MEQYRFYVSSLKLVKDRFNDAFSSELVGKTGSRGSAAQILENATKILLSLASLSSHIASFIRTLLLDRNALPSIVSLFFLPMYADFLIHIDISTHNK